MDDGGTSWKIVIEKTVQFLLRGGGVEENILYHFLLSKYHFNYAWSIWILHQKRIELGKFPSKLKISKVVPVYKKKRKKNNVRSYRITAISPVVFKIYESAIHPKLLGEISVHKWQTHNMVTKTFSWNQFVKFGTWSVYQKAAMNLTRFGIAD